jgi:uncharacterized membrane-anchored protein YhcB (DUF1043 family)
MESILLDILISCVIGYTIGRLIVWLLVKRVNAQLQAELDTLVDRIVDDLLVLATVEVDGNQYLCYNSKTNEFICQGVDIGEIAANFATRFPAKKLAIHDGDATAVETLKKQMEELKNENSSSVRHSS